MRLLGNEGRAARGFTLVELVLILLLVAILAALVIPRFTHASKNTRDTSVATTLQFLRGQLELYKSQHGDTPPAVTQLWTVMQQPTTHNGKGVGPYFRATPLNPWNGMTGISTTDVDTGAGWYYRVNGTQYELLIRDVDGKPDRSY